MVSPHRQQHRNDIDVVNTGSPRDVPRRPASSPISGHEDNHPACNQVRTTEEHGKEQPPTSGQRDADPIIQGPSHTPPRATPPIHDDFAQPMSIPIPLLPPHSNAQHIPNNTHDVNDTHHVDRNVLHILDLQRRFLDNIREPALRQLLPQLREAVSALTTAQKQAGPRVRIHLFVEHDASCTKAPTDNDRMQELSKTSVYTFFSPTFAADTDFKQSLLREFADIIAKFNFLKHSRGTTIHDGLHSHDPIPSATTAVVPITASHSRRAEQVRSAQNSDIPQTDADAGHIGIERPNTIQHSRSEVGDNMPEFVPPLDNPTHRQTPHNPDPADPGRTDSGPNNSLPQINCDGNYSLPVRHPPSSIATAAAPSSPRGAPSAHHSAPTTLSVPVTNSHQDEHNHGHQKPSSPNTSAHIPLAPITVDTVRASPSHSTAEQSHNRHNSKSPHIRQILPPTVPIVIPTWFPYHTKKPQVDFKPQAGSRPPSVQKSARDDNIPNDDDYDNDNNTITNNSNDISNREQHLGEEEEDEVLPPEVVSLIRQRQKIITTNIAPFQHLSLTKLKFIYSVLFRAAHDRYIKQKNSTNNTKHLHMSSSFSYSYFTPPWFPKTIQCSVTSEMIDFETAFLPDLQSLRKGSTSNLALILAAFQEREPEFVSPALQFLLNSYGHLPDDYAMFTAPHRKPKQKRSRAEALPTTSRQSKQHSGQKRRRKQQHKVATNSNSERNSISSKHNSPHRSTQGAGSQQQSLVNTSGNINNKYIALPPLPNTSSQKQ